MVHMKFACYYPNCVVEHETTCPLESVEILRSAFMQEERVAIEFYGLLIRLEHMYALKFISCITESGQELVKVA